MISFQTSTKRPRFSTKKQRCENCGEALDGFDTCDQCGRINL